MCTQNKEEVVNGVEMVAVNGAEMVAVNGDDMVVVNGDEMVKGNNELHEDEAANGGEMQADDNNCDDTYKVEYVEVVKEDWDMNGTGGGAAAYPQEPMREFVICKKYYHNHNNS